MSDEKTPKGTTKENEESDITDVNNESEEKEPLNPNGNVEEDVDAELGVSSTSNTKVVPTDRGWAWVILAGCVFEVFIFGGIMRSFGVLFLNFQLRFNSSASETATMSLIQNIVVSISALFIMTVGLQKFSCRTVITTGGLFVVASYLLTAFTTNINVFYFVQGVIGGFGLSCVHPPMFVMLGTYFVKNKGLANSIFTAGASIGGLVFAPLVIKLFEEYGFNGTMLIISGLLSNIFVSGALMRPPEFYTKRRKAKQKEEPNTASIASVNGHSNGTLGQNNTEQGSKAAQVDDRKLKNGSPVIHTRNDHLELRRMISHDPSMIKVNGNESPLIQRIRSSSVGNRRIRTESECSTSTSKLNGSLTKLSSIMLSISRSQRSIYVNGDATCGSFVDISASAPSPTVEQSCTPDTKTNETFIQRVCDGFKSILLTVFDMKLLKDVSFLYFLLLAFCAVSSAGLTPIFVPTYANEIGVSNERIGILVAIVAAVDFFAKISSGVITDRKWIKRNNIVGLAFFTVGTASHFIRFIRSFQAMIIFVVIVGMCCGQYMSTFAVILSEITGPERFKQSMGFITLTHGISIAIFFPITGLVRDSTNSYVNALHLTGTLAYVAGFCMFTVPLVQKWAKSKKTEKT